MQWTGDYATWARACAASGGYEAPAILEKVVAATREVREGRAAGERDSVLLPEWPEDEHLRAALHLAATKAGGRLSVVDFGGSLGSSYWPRRQWLDTLPAARWAVVDQPHFVAVGRREFANEQLRFYSSIDECCREEQPNLLLLSSVLPYLDEPHAFLADAVKRGIEVIFIDRTGLVDRAADRLTVQRVPRAIFAATIPCWFFNRERLLAHFADGYRLVSEHDTPDGAGSGFAFKGFMFERRA
jgi:putative methyltransferase (TIGR04325 family)